MTISAAAPIDPAIARTKAICFPFNAEKWFALGFCAWLSNLGSTGVPAYNVPPFEDGDLPAATPMSTAELWQTLFALAEPHLPIVLGVAFGLVLISILVAWLAGRGELMFIDGIVRNRGAVTEPWRSYRGEGNSLARGVWCLSWALFLALLVLVFFALREAWPHLQNDAALPRVVLGLFDWLVPIVLVSLLGYLAMSLIHNFVVPVIYKRRCTFLTACDIAWREILEKDLGAVARYLLLRLALSFAAGLVMLFGTLLTCCLGALPILGTVLFLPVWVFLRSYSLAFLEQYGEDFVFFADRAAPPPPVVPGPR